MSDTKGHTILVMSGPAGPSLYLDDYRIAGPKPWGGGTVLHEFAFKDKDLLAAGVTLVRTPPDAPDGTTAGVTKCGTDEHPHWHAFGPEPFYDGTDYATEDEAIAAVVAAERVTLVRTPPDAPDVRDAHVHDGEWCDVCVEHGRELEWEATRD